MPAEARVEGSGAATTPEATVMLSKVICVPYKLAELVAASV